jgi:hypothetical protein
VLGNASAGKVCSTLTFNAPVLAGPSAVGANQVALVDIDNCSSVTFVSPFFNISGIAHAAPLTFSGGGCTTEPTAEAIPNPSGVIKAVTLTYAGAGCTSAPTVAVGGSGSGASITAAEAGGVVTGLTLNTAGTGYTLPTGSIVPLIVKTATKAGTIIDPMCPDGVNGLGSPCWAWIVGGVGYGVNIEGDSYNVPGSGSYSANLIYTTGISGNQHYLSWVDGSGVTHVLSVVPQAYP